MRWTPEIRAGDDARYDDSWVRSLSESAEREKCRAYLVDRVRGPFSAILPRILDGEMPSADLRRIYRDIREEADRKWPSFPRGRGFDPEDPALREAASRYILVMNERGRMQGFLHDRVLNFLESGIEASEVDPPARRVVVSRIESILTFVDDFLSSLS